jgi:RNA polymerase subunit RPABC4/transcription elongation factor Spt4
MAAQDIDSKTEEKAACVCPFCGEEVDPSVPWCVPCQVVVRYCVSCEEPLPQDATVCPNCGTECTD